MTDKDIGEEFGPLVLVSWVVPNLERQIEQDAWRRSAIFGNREFKALSGKETARDAGSLVRGIYRDLSEEQEILGR